MTQTNDGPTYWAAKPIEEIAKAIEEKFNSYTQWGQNTGYFHRIETSYNTFYGFNSEGSLKIARSDAKGNKANLNRYQSILKRLHIMVTEQKLAFDPRAKNSDAKSQIESDLARGICEYYNDEKDMNGAFSEAVLGALIQLESYVHAPWDLTEGYELTADDQNVIRSGDQLFETLTPFNVAKNTASKTSNWNIIRLKVNKFDTAALHPEFADEILSASLDHDTKLEMHQGANRDLNDDNSEDTDDYCWKYILYHARTPSMAMGRKTEIVAGQVLDDGELDYDEIPLYRLTAGKILDTAFADSPGVALLPLQEALSTIFSAMLTNNLNNALQLVWSPDPNMKIGPAENGLKKVSSTTKPEGINLTASASENYKMMEFIESSEVSLSGLNDVANGNPGANVKTAGGQALALAQSYQFISDLQKNYARLAGDVATCLVNNIKRFASEEMTAYITGSTKKGQIKKFKAEDLIDVERISVDLGNPLTQSYAGRSSLIQGFQQYGIIKDPKQIITFLQTGNLDQVMEDDFNDAILIREENEQLKRGEVPPVFLLDRHVDHIMEHKKVSDSPEARENPALMKALQDHTTWHIETMRNVPADLAAILSGQPLPPENPPKGPPPGPVSPEPTVQGQKLPDLPEGAPAGTQANYQQATQASLKG